MTLYTVCLGLLRLLTCGFYPLLFVKPHGITVVEIVSDEATFRWELTL